MTRRAFTRGFHAIHQVPETPPRIEPIAVLANGARVDFLNPKNLIRAVPVIPETLARLTRWTGATGLPYSVAQHCAHFALETRKRGDALAGLHALYHDAHEAIIGDIVRPVEAYIDLECPGILERLRTRIDAALYPALGLDWPVPPATAQLLARVHDEIVCTEMRDLSLHHAPEIDAYARAGVYPLRTSIRPLPWAKAAELFIKTRDALLTESGMSR